MHNGMSMTGKFIKLKQMKLIEYSWQWGGNDELTSEGASNTQVVISYTGFQSIAKITL